MFLLDGRPLPLDRPFTHPDTGVQYPATWLRLTSLAEKEAIGITEVPDQPTPYFDQRFWWDTGIPKDHAQLVDQWVGQVKQTAASLLQGTDWLVIRSQDLSSQKPIPDWALDERGVIRAKSDEKEAAIRATTTTEELAAYVTSPAFSAWNDEPSPAPQADPTPEPALVMDDTLTFSGSTTSANFGV
ncbi:MAG: hypothetical protein ACO3GP_01490 [Candidatus Limnocylindrus sp.]